ncbi:iron reductase domain protein [Parathielavia hyrcaniae]|uniref:Iron reductase domain protein n=1 Tax=Parathielavia hyrcaniae TaxID=113614 RepID=A0AAN6Q3C9_9PEZI|nr:iron reductase domain protein [Parathielavia hyrcaniae]
MLWTLLLGLVAALLRTGNLAAAAQTANAIHRDPEIGLVFTSNFALYKSDGRGITYRIAVPDTAQQYTAYDAIIQMVVPNDVGWAGLSWGGSMPRSPLLVAWRGSSNNVVLSSRMASGHIQPTEYPGAHYTLFQTGTRSNATHWQFTALCRGCTAWQAPGSASARYLNRRGGNRLAMAYSPTRPASANSPSSAIAIHQVHAYWSHDFAQAANADFEAVVQRLMSS